MNKTYEPIIRKVNSWINYEKNRPTCSYKGNEKVHDTYRACNDLDCVLTNGNLYADTIFSLWLPLRYTLLAFHTLEEIIEITGEPLSKQNLSFLEKITNPNMLQILLPINDVRVIKLLKLFEIGQTRANVMLLPERIMNSQRGFAPFYDYMPYFLLECFEGGRFAKFFGSEDILCEWVLKERLTMFFSGDIKKENIIDLACTNSIKYGVPGEHLNEMLEQYIRILEERTNSLEKVDVS